MRNFIQHALLLFFIQNISSQNIVFPDTNLQKTFLLVNCVDSNNDGYYDSSVDLNKDGNLQETEILAVKSLNVSGQNIFSMEGIESFKNLENLVCTNNNISSFELNFHPFIKNLTLAPNNNLNRITVTNNPNLINLDVVYSTFFGKQLLKSLTYLNCSMNSLNKIRFINSNDYKINLSYFNCSNNKLTSISIDPLIQFDSVFCQNNLLKTDSFRIFEPYKLIDISNNSLITYSNNSDRLQNLKLFGNPLENLELLNFRSLIEIENFPNLKRIIISRKSNNFIGNYSSIKISNLPSLSNLQLQTYFDSIVIDGCSLDYVNIANAGKVLCNGLLGMGLTIIKAQLVNISNSPNLINVNLNNVAADSLIISNLNSITNLTCYTTYYNNSNHKKIINTLKDLPSLDTLYIEGLSSTSVATELYINYLPKLKYVSITREAKFNLLEFSNLESIQEINANFEMKNLVISDLSSLKKLYLESPTLESFEIKYLENLEEFTLICGNTSQVKIQSLPNLRKFTYQASSNPLQTIKILEIRQCQKLDSIIFNRPSLDEFIFVELPKLKFFKSYKQGGSTHYKVKAINYKLIDLPELQNVEIIESNIAGLKFTLTPKLKNLYLYNNEFDYNLFKDSFILDGLSLENVTIQRGPFNGIKTEITNMPNLINLDYIYGDKLFLSNLPKLKKLKIDLNFSFENKSYEIQDFPSLEDITIGENLFKLKLKNLPGLYNLVVDHTNLDTLILSSCNKLERIKFNYMYSNTPLTCLGDIPLNVHYLEFFKHSYSQRLNLDFFPKLDTLIMEHFSGGNTPLFHLNLKNGNSKLQYFKSDKINSICIDDKSEIQILKNLNPIVETSTFTSYCNFEPGYLHNRMNGNLKFAINAADCQSSNRYLSNIKIKGESQSEFLSTFTNQLGKYQINPGRISEDYSIMPLIDEKLFTTIPNAINQRFENFNNSAIGNFCIVPNNPVFNDLEVSISPAQQPVPGYRYTINISITNKGNSTLNDIKTALKFDNKIMKIVYASFHIDTLDPSIATWNEISLLPFERKELLLVYLLNKPTDINPLNGGDLLKFEVSANPLQIDDNVANNLFYLKELVVNSFDPNDKICLEGDQILINQLDQFLHYTIRFENTGTFDAKNVVISDYLNPEKFDIQSLEIVSSSHPFYARIVDKDYCEFIFENINLSYLDNFNDGYISFKIKVKSNLVVNQEIPNKAEIYFDYNFPVLTNEYKVRLLDITQTDPESKILNNIYLYPNPSYNALSIYLGNYLQELSICSIFNIEGEELVKTKIQKGNNKINIENLPTGIYFLKIIEKENLIFASKFIKI